MVSGAARVAKIYLPIVAHTSARGAQLRFGSLHLGLIDLRLLTGLRLRFALAPTTIGTSAGATQAT